MAFTEDLSQFFGLGEFAVSATLTPAGGAPVSGNVLFDCPTQDVLGGDALTDEYSITYPATQFAGAKTGDSVSISGANYKIRRPVEKLDDGALVKATLTKV